jgi:NitT/TauT family transport system ATP-binding protein
MSIIKFNNVTFGYSEEKILENLTFEIKKNAFEAILSQSGTGKTTILNLINKRLNPKKGTIIRNFHKCGFIMQQDSLIPQINVLNNVYYACGDKEKSLKYLKAVKLQQAEKLYPPMLSKGMQKRVEIARALSIEPEVLLLDEAFANLDHFTKIAMIAQLKHFSREFGTTVIYVTHDIEEALISCDHIKVLMNNPVSKIIDFQIKEYSNKKEIKKAILEILKKQSEIKVVRTLNK